MYFYMKRIFIHNRGNLYKRLIVEPFYIIEKYILKGLYIYIYIYMYIYMYLETRIARVISYIGYIYIYI